MTFSNRCFPSKAIRGRLGTDDERHVQIVNAYFAMSGEFGPLALAWPDVRFG